ncbi:MAG: PIN domain-containing protein [Candidatus Saccharimonadales bacterium]
MEKSLDANFLLRWLLGDVPTQQDLTDRVMSGKDMLHVADMVLEEIAYVMERVIGLPRSMVANNFRAIMAQANVNCNRSVLSGALPLYEKHTALSFVDCCLAVYAELNGAIPLLTFDKKLARQLPNVELVE